MSKNVKLVLVFIFLASNMFITIPASAFAETTENSWVLKTPLSEARWSMSIAVLNNKIYAIGGSTQKGEYPYTGGIVGTNEAYDPTTNTWETKTPMPTPRYRFSTIVCQNKVYCIGGSMTNGGPKTGVNEAYDPTADKWETKTPMPTSRDYFASIVYQNRIYCIGGYVGDGYTAVNEVYDPATNTWEIKESMPTAKTAQALIINSKIFLIGGNPNNTLNQVYDPALDSWTLKAAVPIEADGASIVVNDKIYFIGGSYSGSQFYTVIQIYDPETDKWNQGASPPSGGVNQETVVATSGEVAPKRIYILDEKLRLYDPETDSWTVGANKTIDRLNLGIATINDRIYAIGGNTYTYSDPTHSIGENPIITTYATNEQYTPFGYGEPDPTSSPTTPPNTEPIPTVPVAVISVASVTVVTAGLIVYFKKRKTRGS